MAVAHHALYNNSGQGPSHGNGRQWIRVKREIVVMHSVEILHSPKCLASPSVLG
jgi:hypothetical protein